MGAPLQEEALSLHPMRTAFLAYYRLNYDFDRFVSAPIQIVRCVADDLQGSTRTVTYDPFIRPADRPQPQRRPLWALQKADSIYTCELVLHDGFGSEARVLNRRGLVGQPTIRARMASVAMGGTGKAVYRERR